MCESCDHFLSSKQRKFIVFIAIHWALLEWRFTPVYHIHIYYFQVCKKKCLPFLCFPRLVYTINLEFTSSYPLEFPHLFCVVGPKPEKLINSTKWQSHWIKCGSMVSNVSMVIEQSWDVSFVEWKCLAESPTWYITLPKSRGVVCMFGGNWNHPLEIPPNPNPKAWCAYLP